MKTIEQQKHRLFICILAAIAVAVNASQEIKYTMAHPAFAPVSASPSYTPVHYESVANSAQTTSAPSEPVFSPQPLVKQNQPEEMNAEILSEPMMIGGKKSAPKQKQMQASTLALQNTTPTINLTNQISAQREFAKTSNSVASTAFPKKPGEILMEHRHQNQVTAMEAQMISSVDPSQQTSDDNETSSKTENQKAQEASQPAPARQHNADSHQQSQTTAHVEKAKPQPTESRNQTKPTSHYQPPANNSHPARKNK